MSLGMLASVYTMERCVHTTERKTVTYIEDLWGLKALNTRTLMLTHGGTAGSQSVSPLFPSPPKGSQVSFELPAPRGRHSRSGLCGSSWTRASGRTTRVPGGSRGGLSAERTGGYSVEREAGSEVISSDAFLITSIDVMSLKHSNKTYHTQIFGSFRTTRKISTFV